MSALVILPTDSAVYVATDAAAYEAGRVVEFRSKTRLVYGSRGCVSGIGNFATIEAIGQRLDAEFCTFDWLLTAPPTRLADVCRGCVFGGADVLVAGFSHERQRPEAYSFRVDDSLPIGTSPEEAEASAYYSDEPFKLIPLTKLVMSPAPADQVDAACWRGINPAERSDKIEWSIRKLLQMQRQTALPDDVGGIGGFGQLTTIRATGTEQKILCRWSDDKIGDLIRPPPIDWRKWHAENPKPA